MSQAFDYVVHHVNVVARDLTDVRGKRVLVVGCNRGREVNLFLNAGAREVWGIDLIDEIGSEYPHEFARYVQMSAQSMDLADEMFEIVFCLATMEHILCPEAAFAEICRVTAPKGLIYALSAPLWNSRQGHHKGEIFDVDTYPWIHLRFGSEELKQMCANGEIEYPESVVDIAAEIDYMMSSAYFNKRPARDYLGICSGLQGIEIKRNELDLEPRSVLELLPTRDRVDLAEHGVDATELLALTHTFTAVKKRRPWRKDGVRRADMGRWWTIRTTDRHAGRCMSPTRSPHGAHRAVAEVTPRERFALASTPLTSASAHRCRTSTGAG